MAWDRSFEYFKDKVVDVLARNNSQKIGAAGKLEYDAFKVWFGERMSAKDWTQNAVCLGGLAIYGWMPTMLHRIDCDPSEAFCNVAKALNLGQKDEIEKRYMNFLNNSYVGTSKFLHFCWPDHFAIWDSRVCKALGWGETGSHAESKAIEYQKYMRAFCKERPASLREVEVALYLKGKKD